MVFDRYPGSGRELLLALALAGHAHDDGTHIYPSIAYLAKKTRQSGRSVQYQLRRMETAGWLILVNAGLGGRRGGYTDGGVTREYRISPAWLKGAEFAPFEGHAKGANTPSKGCKKASERVQKEPSKGATAIAPEPRATKSNPPRRECERDADPLALTVEQVDRELAGFGNTPVGVNREQLARFVRHRAAIRRPLSVQGWLGPARHVCAVDTVGAHGGHVPGQEGSSEWYRARFAIRCVDDGR